MFIKTELIHDEWYKSYTNPSYYFMFDKITQNGSVKIGNSYHIYNEQIFNHKAIDYIILFENMQLFEKVKFRIVQKYLPDNHPDKKTYIRRIKINSLLR